MSRKKACREPDAPIEGMAHYLVRAIPRQGALKRIWQDLESERMVYAPRDEAKVGTVMEVVLLFLDRNRWLEGPEVLRVVRGQPTVISVGYPGEVCRTLGSSTVSLAVTSRGQSSSRLIC